MPGKLVFKADALNASNLAVAFVAFPLNESPGNSDFILQQLLNAGEGTFSAVGCLKQQHTGSLSHHRCPPAGAAGDRSLPVITASTGVHLTLTELTQSAPLLRAVCFLETSCVPTFNLSQQLKRTCGEEVTLNKITSLFIKRQNVSCFTLCNCCLPKNTPVRRAAIFSQFSVVFLQMPG